MGKLTAIAVKNAKEPGRYVDGDGLMLLVKGNSRSWLLRIQVDGRRRDFGLGSANEVSLAMARERAVDMRRQYRSGIDPVAAKLAAKHAVDKALTFAECAEAAFEDQKAGWRNKKHRDQWISSLRAYAIPSIGHVPIGDVDGPKIREVLIPIWLAKPETARRVRQRIGAVLDWAYAKGLRQTEAPMRGIAKALPRQPRSDRHFAAMPYDQVPLLIRRLEAAPVSSGRLALRFLILTAARSGEVRGASWSEIDLLNGTWTIPASRMKAGKQHVVPLSSGALEVLESATVLRTQHDGLIFPGMASRPMSDMTLTKALRSVDHTEATVHGFRSSFRDWAAEQTNHSGEVVEAALAHTIANRVEAAYRRTNYLEKRRVLMKDWSEFVR